MVAVNILGCYVATKDMRPKKIYDRQTRVASKKCKRNVPRVRYPPPKPGGCRTHHGDIITVGRHRESV